VQRVHRVEQPARECAHLFDARHLSALDLVVDASAGDVLAKERCSNLGSNGHWACAVEADDASVGEPCQALDLALQQARMERLRLHDLRGTHVRVWDHASNGPGLAERAHAEQLRVAPTERGLNYSRI